jgi:ribosomal protein L37AE/L43A
MAKGDFQRNVATWMQGRNGGDELGTFCTVVSFIILIINIFLHTLFLSVVALALIIYACWRVASKNLEARESENATFVGLFGPLARWLRNPAAAVAEARTYKHLKCPECGQRVRVPRKKGKLRVTCPSCHEKFEARS